ncbi:MAG: FkbM family methyltransferase [Alphaproteobacteria bacterium]
MRRARALLRSAFRSAASLPLAARGGLDRLDIEEFAGRSKRALEALCRARAQPVYLGGNEALCRILGRYKLYVDTRDAGLGAHLLLDGFWEMGLTIHIARHVRAGMAAIDVGANFGYYTVLLGALVGESGRVLAIEPAPETAAMLRRSVALNGFEHIATVIETAAGAGDAPESLLFVPEREPKNAQLVASPDGLDRIPGTLHRVAQSSVDTLAADQRRIDFIKIDAEGAEEAVIAGMLATLRRDRPHLVLEFNAARARDPGALLATLCTIYGKPRYLDLHGNVLETTPERLLRERFATDWLLVFAAPDPR